MSLHVVFSLSTVPLVDLLLDPVPVPASGVGEVHVGAELLDGGRFGGHAVRRDFEAGGPDEAVQDDLAEVVVGPVDVVVPAGEAEAATAIGALVCPAEMLGHTHSRADVRVVAMSAIRSLTGAVRRDRGEDRRDVLHLRAETHVVVPFV